VYRVKTTVNGGVTRQMSNIIEWKNLVKWERWLILEKPLGGGGRCESIPFKWKEEPFYQASPYMKKKGLDHIGFLLRLIGGSTSSQLGCPVEEKLWQWQGIGEGNVLCVARKKLQTGSCSLKWNKLSHKKMQRAQNSEGEDWKGGDL